MHILWPLVAALTGASAFAGVQPAANSFLSEECKKFISETLPAHGWKGGFLSVPRDWKNPERSPRTQVFYYYEASRDLQKTTPIFFFNGGPFANYHNRMEALQRQVRAYDEGKRHTFVMMDQRGTGCSAPSVPAADGSTAVADLALYASDAIARDAEAVRRELFPTSKWKIFGQSYGGFLTVRYLSLFGENVSEAHVYGPVFHETMSDFFLYRIVKQQDVLKKFLAHYRGLNLERAFAKIASPEGKTYCLEATATTSRLCGQVLLDSFLATIGQGRGRGLGTTEVWDSVRDGMMNLIKSTSDPRDEARIAFLKMADSSLAFFRGPGSIMPTILWASDLQYISGDNSADCDFAYAALRARGIDPAELALDECRIIKEAVSPEQREVLKRNFAVIDGKEKLAQGQILRVLSGKARAVPFSVYTGELDSLAQRESMASLLKNPRIKAIHFPESGHAGWLFEPVFWRALMK